MLVSCVAVKEETVNEPSSWQAQQKKRQQIVAWEVRGRLGVQTEKNGGSLDVIWQQYEQDYTIRLIAPLASGNYLIQGNAEYAEVRHPDGHKEIIDDVDKIFSSVLQVELPVAAIRDWLRGLPAKRLSIQEITWNEKGLINVIRQAGWRVEMKKYTGTDILMPHVIYLSRADNAELDIRLAIRRWLIDAG